MNMRRLPSIALVAMATACLCGASLGQTVQEHVHAMSHNVMPFDMSKTIHIFKMTDQGGVESVVSKGSDAASQVPMIREHLRHEAVEFQKGNYGDPAALHGTVMPGLSELQRGASHIKITYADLPNGGAITFKSENIQLLTAIHRWFGAQLSEHGADARAE